MALNIKNEEVDRLARELASRTGLSITDVLLTALTEMNQRRTGSRRPRALRNELLEIGRRCAQLPDLDTRTPEEILGFNEIGVPR